jgi:capsular exopolysaccharide synthesis family protein
MSLPRTAPSPAARRLAAPMAEPDAVAGEGRHPLDYLAILRRHLWLALAGFLAVALPAAAWTLLQVPVYRAQTRLLLGEPSTPLPTLARQGEPTRSDTTRTDLQTQYELLASRALASRVVRRLNLGSNQLFLAPVPSPFSLIRFREVLSGPPPPSSVPPSSPAAPEAGAGEAPPGSIDRLLAGLIVAPLIDSRLVDVKYESRDPALAAQVANAIAQEFIEQDLQLQSQSTEQSAAWLNARLAEQRARVEQSEQALQRFKEQQDALSVEDRQNIVVGSLTDINAAVTRAKTERLAKEQIWNQVNAVRGDREALLTTPAIQQSPLVQSLRTEVAGLQRERAQLGERFGPKHPEMVRITTALENARGRLDAEVDKAVATVRAEYMTALAQERSLSSALDRQKGEALSLNRKDLAYGALEREAISNRQVYEALQQQAKQATLASELRQSSVRIVDAAAVPGRPVRPDTTRGLAFGLLGAALFGVGLAFAREFLDRRIKSPTDLHTHLKLPCLGLVPALNHDRPTIPLLDAADVPAGFSEAIRKVRSSLWIGLPGGPPCTVLVAGTAPRDGKSLLAANLAMALAATGERVLLIDGDLRRPALHATFGLEQQPGLSMVLAGRAQPADAVSATKVAQLSLLPAGPLPPNPSELLGRGRFGTLLEILKPSFEWIIVDTPPVLAVTDAVVMAPAANAVIFVASADATRCDAAAEAVDQLRASGAVVLGGVLNRVALTRNASYYSRYYRKDYERYYVGAGRGTR